MLRVLTWNVWWRNGPWEARQEGIAATLEREEPDVVCLQEVWAEEGGHDQAERLAERLGLIAVRADDPFVDGLAFGNAVLSRWPVTDSATYRLPGEDGAPSHRTVLWVQVDAPFGRLPVFTTHLEWRYDASAVRSAQVAEVAAVVARHRGDPDGFPPVLTGDLNATPASDEVRALTGLAPPPVPGLVFQDAWDQAGDGGRGSTWSRANPYLADATWPERRLDYVLVAWPRRRPLGNATACRLAGTEAVGGVVPSDHYAVVADLRA